MRSSLNERVMYDRVGGTIFPGIDVTDFDKLRGLCVSVKPDVVINCAGITKHVTGSDDPLLCIPVNSLAPHQLAHMASIVGAKFIHISTDCVFSGQQGQYGESDTPDAVDLYGKSKALGEVVNSQALTIRTSTIGHEINSKLGLLDWFLSQHEECKGFSRAVFSGLPTVTLARVIRDVIVPRRELCGLYNVAASPINKFELLKLISKVYGKNIVINESPEFVIDRSLTQSKFLRDTGFQAPSWNDLIYEMHDDYRGAYNV